MTKRDRDEAPDGKKWINWCLLHLVPLPPFAYGPFRFGDIVVGDKISVRRNGRIVVGRVLEIYNLGVRYKMVPDTGPQYAASYGRILKVHFEWLESKYAGRADFYSGNGDDIQF